MSEFLALDHQLDGEDPTVEGRLADIIEPDDCVVHVDEYKLSHADKQKVIRALRLAGLVAKIVMFQGRR